MPVNKVQGRKNRSVCLLTCSMKESSSPEEQVIAISHAVCKEDVDFLMGILQEKYCFQDIINNQIGPVIGSHAGPGTIALFFLGQGR